MVRAREESDIGRAMAYDPDFQGPLKNRSCTDVICLAVFLVFIGAWIGVGIFAIKNGDPEMLLVPKDSKGRRCGMDEEVKDKPYLLFFDLSKCLSPNTPFLGCKTPQICVKNCPHEAIFEESEIKSKHPEFCSSDDQKCPPYILPSDPVEYRCLPKLSGINDYINQINAKFGSEEKFYSAIKNAKLISEAEEISQNVVEDIIHSWWKILIGVVLAVVTSLIFIIMLRWFAAFMVWLSLLGIVLLIAFGTYFSAKKYLDFKKEYDEYKEDEAKTKRDMWLGVLIVVSILLIIIVLMLIFLRKRIMLAIALIGEGSKAVSSVTSVLVFPIFPWVLQILIIAYAVVVGLYLASSGEPIYKFKEIDSSCSKVHLKCSPQDEVLPGCQCKFIGLSKTKYYPYLQTLNAFGFFWLAFFASALSEMILAGVFAQWYWTKNKRNLPFFAVTGAILRTLRYHIGTLAFGSLIIAICRMIRLALEYIDRKLKLYNENPIAKAILCCMKCFFWCLEKFLKFINKNAYIMCAIHGKNFCASAKDAFLLLMRNIIRVVVLDKVTDFLFFISKLLITLGVGSVSYILFATDFTSIDNSTVNYTFVPVIIIMVITYLITSIFFGVYSMAVDTLFLCFLEDCERNDGSPEKPYCMSKNLMKILGKKNKKTKLQ